MDLIVRNARLPDATETVDLGISGGRIVAIEPVLSAEGE
jgi:cytosine deaminase